MIHEFQESVETYKLNVDKFTDTKLCEVVATFRYIGMMKEEALASMVELARRRMLGDDFPFEQKIDEIYNSLPKIKLDNTMFDLGKGIL